MWDVKRFGTLFIILLLAACSQLQPQQQVSEDIEPLTSRYTTDGPTANLAQTQTEYAIVVFADPPAASYEGGIPGLTRTRPTPGAKLDPDSPAVRAYVRHLENQHADFLSFLRREAPRAEVVSSYTHVLNGMAIKLNGASLQTLARGPRVRAVAYSGIYWPTMNKSIELISADQFWHDTGLTGAGVKVGVIDSGIDDSHPFFSCKSNIPHKVYASGVAFNPDNVLVSDHGTHVAGTIAGCAGTEGPLDIILSGVAPDAELYDYNVFPGFGGGYLMPRGSAFSHDIARAIEDAVVDGVDVINMSLGGSVDGPHDFLAEASNAAVDAGVVVVTSAGNSGPGRSTVGSPGTAEKVITVGASTNSHNLAVMVNVDFETAPDASFVSAEGIFDPFVVTPALDKPLSSAADFSDELACSSLSAIPEGTVVLIRRGDCSFTTKIRNAELAGAYGVVVYNNNPGEGALGMGHDGTEPEPTIPAVMISYEDGTEILSTSSNLSSTTTVTIDGNNPVEIDVDPDILADFSSRGPAAFTGILKPDLTAPGVNVLSSVFDGGYALFLGTSMSSPHVAGAAALLRQAHPGWSPEEVKAALVTGTDLPDTLEDLPFIDRGNGRLNVAKANNVPVLITPPSVSFGFHNRGGRSNIQSVTLNLRSVSAVTSCTATASGGVSLSSTDVTLSPSATVTVSLTNPNRRTGDEEGEIVFNCGSESLRVPWGSYQK